MKYSNGNIQAYSRARKPKNIDKYEAYIVGSGLSALATTFFLVRDGHMEGNKIHIFKKSTEGEGAWKRTRTLGEGNIIEVGEELDPHFEALYDILRDVPSLDTENASVLDEIIWINEDYPNKANVRSTEKQAEELHNDFHFNLNDRGIVDILKFYVMPEEKLYDKEIREVLSKDVLNSNFWIYWSNLFYFSPKDSALELKKYLQRFLYDISNISDQSDRLTCKYTVTESIIKPLVSYLKNAGVDFRHGVAVENVKFDITPEKSLATSVLISNNGIEEEIKLLENDLLFITIGSSAENASLGNQNEAPMLNGDLSPNGSWNLWRKIAKQDINFGNPDKFCDEPNRTKFVTATITTLDERIPQYIRNIVRRDPFGKESVSGGNVTIKDSSWGLNWHFGRQPVLKDQKDGHLIGEIYGITPDNIGDYVSKKMIDCTGKEICMEWLYHMGVPTEIIDELAEESAHTVPLVVPFLMSYLIPRAEGDRPMVVPEGSKNFAFIGHFSQIGAETAFSIENAARTGMEAVYTLLPIERSVPEVWASSYDIRDLLSAMSSLLNGQPISSIKLPSKGKKFVKEMNKFIGDSEVRDLLERYNIIQEKTK